MFQSASAKAGFEEFGEQMKICEKETVDVKVSSFKFNVPTRGLTLCTIRSGHKLMYHVFQCLGCDCYKNGTKHCLKRSYNYCKCRNGFEGNKCNHLNNVVMVNDEIADNITKTTAFHNDSKNIGWYTNGKEKARLLSICISEFNIIEFLKFVKFTHYVR